MSTERETTPEKRQVAGAGGLLRPPAWFPPSSSLLGLLWGALVLFFYWLQPNPSRDLKDAMVLNWAGALALIAMDPIVLLHELAHAAAGRLVDCRIMAVLAGPIVLRFQPSLSLGFNRNSKFLGVGMTYYRPRDGSHLLRRALLVTIAGPLFSIAVAACLLVIAPGQQPLLKWTCWMLAVLTVWSALPDLVHLRRLASRDVTVLGRLQSAALNESVNSRKRPNQWGFELADLVPTEHLGLDTPDGTGWARLLALCVALDNGETTIARRMLSEILPERSAYSAGVRTDLALQTAAFLALVDGDPLAASRELETLPTPEAAGYDLIARAAIASARGDASAARTLLTQWRESIGPNARAAQGNEWIVEAIERRSEQLS